MNALESEVLHTVLPVNERVVLRIEVALSEEIPTLGAALALSHQLYNLCSTAEQKTGISITFL